MEGWLGHRGRLAVRKQSIALVLLPSRRRHAVGSAGRRHTAEVAKFLWKVKSVRVEAE